MEVHSGSSLVLFEACKNHDASTHKYLTTVLKTALTGTTLNNNSEDNISPKLEL